MLPWVFSLSGDWNIGLGEDFSPPPPTRFFATPGYPLPRLCASEFRSTNAALDPWAEHPSQGFAPQRPWHSTTFAGAGYGFTSRAASDCPEIGERSLRRRCVYRSCQDRWWAPIRQIGRAHV